MKNIINGFFIGISNVIPGVCSGLIAMVLNCYDTLLDITANPFSLKTLWKYRFFVIGIIGGLLIAITGITYLYEKYPSLIQAFFMGLIMVGIINLRKVTITKGNNAKLLIGIGMLIVFVVSFININNEKQSLNLLLIALAGLISAVAFVMPGISGSLILLLLGVYFPIMAEISIFIKHIIVFTFPPACTIIVICVFLICFLIGMILCSRFIKYVLAKNANWFYQLCLGMTIASLITLLIDYQPAGSLILLDLLVMIFTFIVILCLTNKYK